MVVHYVEIRSSKQSSTSKLIITELLEVYMFSASIRKRVVSGRVKVTISINILKVMTVVSMKMYNVLMVVERCCNKDF